MITEKAFAKLNLNLHILPDLLPNGFHEVHFLNCEIDLHDDLSFEFQSREIEVISDVALQVEKEQNLIYKAAMALKKKIGDNALGAKIILQKNIPIKAGLGGGSSDAAATLRGLTQLWRVTLNDQNLLEIAEKIGKDVPYSLQGGLCEVKGDGNQIIPLSYILPELWLIIIFPPEEKPSTGWMYSQLDHTQIGKNLQVVEEMKTALKSSDKSKFLHTIFNDFEVMVYEKFPRVQDVKDDLNIAGAEKVLLAGSGLSVVGFFTSISKRDEAVVRLGKKYEVRKTQIHI
jgi:4-diphosphocytidyl-2-C-methyl-D-erythritol kinase